jgi:hypothetical protein
VEVERVQSSSSEPSFDLVESKLRPPVARRGIVARTALVDRLVAATQPVISVVVPAGYGKPTFLAQWAERKQAQVGWVSVDDRDNDPVVLLTYIKVALDRVEAIDPRVFRALASSVPDSRCRGGWSPQWPETEAVVGAAARAITRRTWRPPRSRRCRP